MFLNLWLILTVAVGLLIIFNTNVIISLFFLIALFVNASITLIFFGFDFFGLIFIAIYAGAIAVLFLFIVMMINIPYVPVKNYFFIECFVILGLIVLLAGLSHLFSRTPMILPNLLYSSSLILMNHQYTDSLALIAALLYTHYSIFLLIAAVMLFLAMIGSVMVFAEYRFNDDIRRYNTYLQ